MSLQDFLGLSGSLPPPVQKANAAFPAHWRCMKPAYVRLKNTFMGKFFRSAIYESLSNRIQKFITSPISYPPMNPDFAGQL